MSSVCDLGTIRTIIRGVNEPPPHTLISEMIDDAEHSKSKKVFIDINTRDKMLIYGFENSASVEQINKMVTWNPVSIEHASGDIATCGQGLKYYEFRFRGEQTHLSKRYDPVNHKNTYVKSKLNSDTIYDAAHNFDVSETGFSEILKRNTYYAEETDEIVPSIEQIFNAEDDKYPFKANTLIISKKINDSNILDWLNDDKNITDLEKELINKYYAEIKCKSLSIYVKFPKDTKFKELCQNAEIDVIGSTLKHKDEHIIEIYHIENDFDDNKKGDYLIQIKDTFFTLKNNGTSYNRKSITVNKEHLSNMFHAFTFQQYTLNDPTKQEEDSLKKTIVGTSLEAYSGIYLKIGDKFIDGKPITANITKRNLPGAKFYRGILQMRTPKKTKMILGIQGLKSNFNLSTMQNLEFVVKQCCIIYKSFHTKFNDKLSDFRKVNPSEYAEVKTSNQKTKKTSMPGHMYLRVVGKNFYKLGKTGLKNRSNRIFDKLSEPELEKLRTTFPEEEIYDSDKQYYEYLSPHFNSCSSTEQKIKENLLQIQEVLVYNNKVGDDIREYFHCESLQILHDIKRLMIESL